MTGNTTTHPGPGARRWSVLSVACRDHDGRWHAVDAGAFGAGGPTVGVALPAVWRLEFAPGLSGTLELRAPSEAPPLATGATPAGNGADLELALDVPGAAWCAVDLVSEAGEHYLGFGERFDGIDKRGREVRVEVVNGASGNLAYKPVPFFISSRGYGVHVVTDARLDARMAVPDSPASASLRVAHSSVALRFYHGTPSEVLAAYTAEAGRPALPPAWVFGPWKSRDWTLEDQSTVLEDVRESRRCDLANSVKLIDAKWETAEHTFAFDVAKYPDAASMVREIRESGMRLVLWLSPWLVLNDDTAAVHAAAAAKGYLIKDRRGETYVHRLGNSPDFVGSCVDFTNPAAVTWWQENVRKLVELGVDGFKTDFGEQVPEDAVFFDGSTGAQMHNVFPRLYNAVTYEAMQSRTNGVLLARSAWHGSQGISAIWAGDQSSDFGPATGLQSVIRAGQNAGASGFPYWASDIGGYFSPPTDEVFARWAQFGAFSPIMQIHGMGKHEPWRFEPRTLEIYRAYAQLHTDLFPYLYAAAQAASADGVPIMRPMAFAFPGADEWGDTQEHQYLFGDSLLVAPVYVGFNKRKGVWLPRGADWFELWTGRRYAGGQTAVVDVPLERIPVFARAGSLVPLLAASPRTLDCEGDDPLAAWPDLDVLVYPGKDARFRLTDGTELRWDDAGRRLEVTGSPRSRRVAVHLMAGAGLAIFDRTPGTRAVAGGPPAALGVAQPDRVTSIRFDHEKEE
ncbi:MAG: glycoside hydrolase family 31 protein [Trueperaceae bacterium]|nr:glycoside hydrolase family 31 protein [Trueperaceae bacterium]